MRLGDFSAHVVVDSVHLDEFDVVVDEAKRTATCYVPSQIGKKFSITWTCSSLKRELWTCGKPYVDGVCCGEWKQKPGRLGEGDTATCEYMLVDNQTMRDLLFSDLKLTDDEAYLHTSIHEKLGEISLIVFQGNAVVQHIRTAHRVDVKENQTVHERSKKAMVHCVGFGEPRRRLPPPTMTYMHQTGPTFSFVFKYRPLAILQAQDIAPAPQPVGSKPKKRPNASDDVIVIHDDPEESELNSSDRNARIQAIRAELARLDAGDGASIGSAVKAEPSSRPAKRVKRERDRSAMPTETIVID